MAIAGLLLSAFVGGPVASAQTTQTTVTPETYVGSAAGRALNVTIAGRTLTVGSSAVSADSTLKAVAESTGALGVPIIGGNNAGKVEVQGNGTRETKQGCVTPSLPVVSSIVPISSACSSVLVEVSNGNPHALAEGGVLNLDVKAQTVLNTPLSAIKPVIDGALGGLETLNKTLTKITGEKFDLKLDDTLGQVVDALKTVNTLSLKVGTSTSEVLTNAGTVTSKAVAQAGVIDLLPLGAAVPGPNGTIELKPILQIVIGSASATAIYDRTSGTSKPSFDPALVTIRVNTPTTDALGNITGINFREIKVAPNLTAENFPNVAAALVQKCPDAPNEFCLLFGTPLETRIAIASGRTFTNADGSVGAVADAVKIHALKNIGTVVSALNGGILLEFAHAEAGVGGRPAETNILELPELPRELPRTGGTPWLPVAGMVGLGIALVARRTLAARSN